jgi:hypothetical protein
MWMDLLLITMALVPLVFQNQPSLRNAGEVARGAGQRAGYSGSRIGVDRNHYC